MKTPPLAAALGAAALLTLSIGQAGAADVNLPKTLAWSAYDLNTAGYAQSVAIGKAFKEKYGISLRVVPGKNDISRTVPLRQGSVSASANGVGTYFAQEGVFEFGTRDWGPQALRVIMSAKGKANIMLGVAGDIGVKTYADLKGKRVAWVKGSPALNFNATAFLAFGGLTWKDVEKVEFAGYGASWDGIINNQVDAAIAITNSGKAVQTAASPRGLVWPETPHNDKAGWARLMKVAPYMGKNIGTEGATMSAEKPLQGQAYPYPILTVYDSAPGEYVYSLTKAMVEAFDLYKDGAPGAEGWALSAQSWEWAVPYHDAAIDYFKEAGVWTADAQKNNDALVKRQQVLAAAWADFNKAAPADDAAFEKGWEEARRTALEKAGLDSVF